MSPLLWILMLIGVGLALIMLEVFVPSGGVLGLLSVVALGAGVVTAFVEQGPLVGVGVLASTFLAVPVVLAAAFRWFPATPLGRRVLPTPLAGEEVLPDAADRHRLRGLVGRHGRTTSELLPWGIVVIDEVSVDAVSDGGPIENDTAVEAVGVQGRAIVVRGLVTPVATAATPPADAVGPHPAAPADTAADRLSSVLEEFDFEELRKNKGPADSLDSPPSANQS